jgi:hypothetical protein
MTGKRSEAEEEEDAADGMVVAAVDDNRSERTAADTSRSSKAARSRCKEMSFSVTTNRVTEGNMPRRLRP